MHVAIQIPCLNEAETLPAVLAATDPDRVLRNDLYDRDPARQWARGTIVAVGDAAHPMPCVTRARPLTMCSVRSRR